MDVVKQKDSNISVLSLWHTHDSQDEFLSANSSFVIFHQSNVLLAVLKQLQLFDPPTFMRKKITSLDPPNARRLNGFQQPRQWQRGLSVSQKVRGLGAQ